MSETRVESGEVSLDRDTSPGLEGFWGGSSGTFPARPKGATKAKIADCDSENML